MRWNKNGNLQILNRCKHGVIKLAMDQFYQSTQNHGTYQLSEIPVKGKITIGDSTHNYEPTKSQDATDPTENSAHNEIQETPLPFNDIEANSILLDECKGTNKIHPPNIPVLPLPRGSPMATPPVPNPFDDQFSILTSIQNLLEIKPLKLMDHELQFDISTKAAVSNFELLKSAHFDFKTLCNRGKKHNNIRLRIQGNTRSGTIIETTPTMEKIERSTYKWSKIFC